MTSKERTAKIKIERSDVKVFLSEWVRKKKDERTSTMRLFDHYWQWRAASKLPSTLLSLDIFGRFVASHGIKLKPIRFGKEVLRGAEGIELIF